MLQPYFLILSIFGLFILGYKGVYRIKKEKLLKKEKTKENLRKQAEQIKKEEEEDVFYRKEILEQDQNSSLSLTAPEIHYLLTTADSMVSRKHYDEAEKNYIHILVSDKNHIQANTELALLYLKTEKFRKAEALYAHLKKFVHENPLIYNNLGLALFKQKKHDEALAAYQKAIELDADNPERFVNLGKVYYAMRKFSTALQAFLKAVEKDPINIGYLFLIADLCKESEQFDRARIYYSKILKIDPKNGEAKKEIRYIDQLLDMGMLRRE